MESSITTMIKTQSEEPSQNSTVKSFVTLDIAKFLCAVLVIALHANPFESFSKVLAFADRHIITVVAVPFFFMCSGFLFRPEKVGKSLKRLLRMYILWSAVYLIFQIADCIQNGYDFLDWVSSYIKNFFISGSFATIWFLLALLVAMALYYFLTEKLRMKSSIVLVISTVLYVIGCAFSAYAGLLGKSNIAATVLELYYSAFDTVKNGVIFFGLVYFAMGHILRENDRYLLSMQKSLIGLAVSSIIVACEALAVTVCNFNTGGCDLLISLLPFEYFFICFVLSLDIRIKSSTALFLRKMSILMFLTQRIPLTILERYLYPTIGKPNSFVNFLIVLLSTICISFVLLRISERIRKSEN